MKIRRKTLLKSLPGVRLRRTTKQSYIVMEFLKTRLPRYAGKDSHEGFPANE